MSDDRDGLCNQPECSCCKEAYARGERIADLEALVDVYIRKSDAAIEILRNKLIAHDDARNAVREILDT